MKARAFPMLVLALLLAPCAGFAQMSFSQAPDGTAGTLGDTVQTGFLNGTISAILSFPPCAFGPLPSRLPGTPPPTVRINPTQPGEIDVSSVGGGIASPPPGGFVCDPQDNPAFTLKAPLGKLADGRYTVVWDIYPSRGAGTFAVVGGLLSSIYPSAVTGTWYDPAASGTGFTFQMSNGLLVTYYGWDASGNRLWLTSDIGPSSLIPNTPILLNMSYTSSGTFNSPRHDVVAWGTLVLNFQNCHAATAKLSGKDGTVNLKLSVLAPAVGPPGC